MKFYTQPATTTREEVYVCIPLRMGEEERSIITGKNMATTNLCTHLRQRADGYADKLI